MKPTRKLFKNNYLLKDSLGVLLVRMGGLIAQILVFALVARVHSLKDVGIYAVANTIWVIVRALGSGGYDEAVLRFIPEFTIKKKPTWISQLVKFVSRQILIFWAFIFINALLTCGIIVFFFQDFKQFSVLIFIVAVGLPAYALMGIDVCFLRTQNKILRAQIPESLYLPFIVALGLGFMYVFNIDSIVLTLILQASAAWCILHLYRKRTTLESKSRIRNEIESEKIDLAAIKKMSASTMKSKIATTLAARSSLLILPILVSSGEIALFEAGLKFGVLASLPVWAVGVVVSPLISKAFANEDIKELKHIYSIANLLQTIPAILIFIVLILFGETFLGVLLGEQFRQAYPITVVIALATTINAAGSIASNYLLMTKGEHIVETFSYVALAIMLTGVIIGTLSFGLIGAGWALVLRSTTRDMGMIIYVSVKRQLFPVLFPLSAIQRKFSSS